VEIDEAALIPDVAAVVQDLAREFPDEPRGKIIWYVARAMDGAEFLGGGAAMRELVGTVARALLRQDHGLASTRARLDPLSPAPRSSVGRKSPGRRVTSAARVTNIGRPGTAPAGS
jgi:hypothetical protein